VWLMRAANRTCRRPASFTMAAATTFGAGDVQTITAPTPADATLANLAWTLSGTL